MTRPRISVHFRPNPCKCAGAMSPIDPTACRNNDMRPWIIDNKPRWELRSAEAIAAEVDEIAAQLSWWLPRPAPHPMPGNAPHPPLDLAIARMASEIERGAADEREPARATEAAKEIRAQIEVDFAYVGMTERVRAYRYGRRGDRWFARGSQTHRQWVLDRQRPAASQRWIGGQGARRARPRVLGIARREAAVGEVVEVDVYFTDPAVIEVARASAPVSIGWRSLQSDPIENVVAEMKSIAYAKVTKIEANKLALGNEFKRLALDLDNEPSRTKRPLTDKDRGRAFLLSKQRRSQRGAR